MKNREQVMADLMRETEDVASKRKAYREMRDLLKSALDIVNEVLHCPVAQYGCTHTCCFERVCVSLFIPLVCTTCVLLLTLPTCSHFCFSFCALVRYLGARFSASAPLS